MLTTKDDNIIAAAALAKLRRLLNARTTRDATSKQWPNSKGNRR